MPLMTSIGQEYLPLTTLLDYIYVRMYQHISNLSLFKLIISDHALITLK